MSLNESIVADATHENVVNAMGADQLKVMGKRILNKYCHPPDLQEEAVKTVLAQAEFLCAEWAV